MFGSWGKNGGEIKCSPPRALSAHAQVKFQYSFSNSCFWSCTTTNAVTKSPFPSEWSCQVAGWMLNAPHWPTAWGEVMAARLSLDGTRLKGWFPIIPVGAVLGDEAFTDRLWAVSDHCYSQHDYWKVACHWHGQCSSPWLLLPGMLSLDVGVDLVVGALILLVPWSCFLVKLGEKSRTDKDGLREKGGGGSDRKGGRRKGAKAERWDALPHKFLADPCLQYKWS